MSFSSRVKDELSRQVSAARHCRIAEMNADLYIDKDNKISVQLKADGKKIKTNLRLPAKEVTYLRYIMDSNFIPTTAHIKKDKKGYKVDITIG